MILETEILCNDSLYEKMGGEEQKLWTAAIFNTDDIRFANVPLWENEPEPNNCDIVMSWGKAYTISESYEKIRQMLITRVFVPMTTATQK